VDIKMMQSAYLNIYTFLYDIELGKRTSVYC
jgi:hypothetical protein